MERAIPGPKKSREEAFLPRNSRKNPSKTRGGADKIEIRRHIRSRLPRYVSD